MDLFKNLLFYRRKNNYENVIFMFYVITFACATSCSIGNTYVFVVDVDITRVLAIVDVGGVIIMISHKKNSKKSLILGFQSA